MGGVLEHPANSQAWRYFGLPTPGRSGWVSRIDEYGWAGVTDQHWYGFPTRKATWLYFVGPDPRGVILGPSVSDRGCETLWSTERSKTTPAFRDVLLYLARSVEQ